MSKSKIGKLSLLIFFSFITNNYASVCVYNKFSFETLKVCGNFSGKNTCKHVTPYLKVRLDPGSLITVRVEDPSHPSALTNTLTDGQTWIFYGFSEVYTTVVDNRPSAKV